MAKTLNLPPDFITEAMDAEILDGLRREFITAADGGYEVRFRRLEIDGALHDEVRFSSIIEKSANFGWLAIRYETGGKGSGTVSTGIGDKGGVSYGAFQLKSRDDGGRVREFLASDGQAFAAAFPTPGNEETALFAQAWRKLAEEKPQELFDAEFKYIIRTHYDPQVRRIEAGGQLVVASRSATLREVVLSTAIQHGPNTTIITESMAQLAATGVNPSGGRAYDRRLIEAVYAERTRRFPKTAARYTRERNDALAAMTAEEASVPPVSAPPSNAENAEFPPWVDVAFGEFGLGVGEGINPELSNRISSYFTFTTGGKALPETTSWCGAFLAYCLTAAEAIPPRTGSARAEDWLLWGVNLQGAARYGCIVVLRPQDLAQETSGHVGIFLGEEGGRISIISGNTHNAVAIGTYPVGEVRAGGYRWPTGWPL